MPGDGSSPWSAAARSAWPDVHLPDEVFRAYVRERVTEESSVDPDVASALWIACACARGDAHALRAFEARYMPLVERAVARLRLRPADVADVVQSLRQHLLAPGSDGSPPRIAEYAGRGDLAGWLRVTAVRAALKKLRGKRPESDDDDALLAARSAEDDPELSYMKAVYRSAFREAFAAAVAVLEPREKNLLRQHFVDGLSVDELGPLYGVHRATAARWVQRARERVLTETRHQFMSRARLSTRECESVLRMVRSRMDITLARLLA
jgi:RNA polymerase sigma-70 factor (ECF subfamily)